MSMELGNYVGCIYISYTDCVIKKEKKENTEKKIRDLDNAIRRRSNIHLIRLLGEKETEK